MSHHLPLPSSASLPSHPLHYTPRCFFARRSLCRPTCCALYSSTNRCGTLPSDALTQLSCSGPSPSQRTRVDRPAVRQRQLRRRRAGHALDGERPHIRPGEFVLSQLGVVVCVQQHLVTHLEAHAPRCHRPAARSHHALLCCMHRIACQPPSPLQRQPAIRASRLSQHCRLARRSSQVQLKRCCARGCGNMYSWTCRFARSVCPSACGRCAVLIASVVPSRCHSPRHTSVVKRESRSEMMVFGTRPNVGRSIASSSSAVSSAVTPRVVGASLVSPAPRSAAGPLSPACLPSRAGTSRTARPSPSPCVPSSASRTAV
eukprot:m.218635 g.218635  ORF g.218635 m.218635 type:complete len:316 (+) comp15607_c1_seq13:1732-2679(+)